MHCGLAYRLGDWKLETWVLIPALPLCGLVRVNLGKSLNRSVPQFPLCERGGGDMNPLL